MQNVLTTEAPSELEFADLVDALAADPNQRQQLIHLLREDHPFYNQRGAATIVRMRGWVLLAIARSGVSDDTLLFVLEELDTGVDPYLVAAAACALRSYPNPNSALAPFVMRALAQIRYHDEPVSFEAYGDYAISSTGTSPVRELLVTLAWLGPLARGVLPEIETVVKSGGLAKKVLSEAERALEAIHGVNQTLPADADTCCTLPAGLISQFSWSRNSRHGSESIESTVFEDHDGELITFKELFRGHPSIVVFFYTRCNNPLKCSLTVTKLARIQKLLELHELGDQIHTAAITYDPAFDLSPRIRGYGQNRGVRMNGSHRMLRATEGNDALRRHFKLGVNFIESLVNRHRIEAYVLDAEGRIAASFERLHWDEREVVDRATEVLTEGNSEKTSINPPAPEPAAAEPPALNLPASNPSAPERRVLPRTTAPVWGTLASLGVAFFPKCPVCWAAYLSVLGIVGLNQIPYSPWLQPLLVAVMLINLVSVWLRARLTGQMTGAYLVTTGALAIVSSKAGPGWESAAVAGVVLTLAGSLFSAASSLTYRKRSRDLLNQA